MASSVERLQPTPEAHGSIGIGFSSTNNFLPLLLHGTYNLKAKFALVVAQLAEPSFPTPSLWSAVRIQSSSNFSRHYIYFKLTVKQRI